MDGPLSPERSRKAPPTMATSASRERRSTSTATAREMLHPASSSSPASSAPRTPRLSTPRRPSHAATSPLQPQEASPLRRASSAMGLTSARPGSSAGTHQWTARGSRHSLGGGSGELAPDDERRPTPKRSISNLIANLREAQGGPMEVIAEPVPLTAVSIAIDHFERELRAHSDDRVEAQTVVIIHDACYGHRYSRLKTTKASLSLIVERPERIAASVLGAAAAYVRLGAHHTGASHAPHPHRQHAAPPPFKIRRTARSIDITSSCVTNVHGATWMAELQRMCHAAGDKLAAGSIELGRVPTPTEPEKHRLHEGDLYLCPESLNAFQGALGGVADAVDAVFSPATSTYRAFVAIRPPGHHCSADHPSGFCWLNNIHVGIEYAAQTYGLTHAAILDFDLHHGDGSQAITWERNSRNNQKRLNAKPSSKLKLSPDVGYFSLHDINSYPCEMGDDEKVQAASLCVENAHGQSVWNVHLQPWKTEDEFWELYDTRYKILVDKARVFLTHHTTRMRAESGGKVQPRAAIFISAGFDASEWEGAGMQRHKVNVPTGFYARFTRDVVELAQEASSGCEGRVISVLEGGYSDRALCSGVLSHLCGLCAQPMEVIKEVGLAEGAGLDELVRGLHIDRSPTTLSYDKTWWSLANLTALEMKVNPPPPPGPGKKARVGPQPTYATPTESFAYKVVDPNKFARSISGTLRESPAHVRPPTPPPPEVDWIVATQELHRLLIPLDRSTQSCTAEELGGVRAKKDRQSAMPVFSTEESARPRQLRDRKAKGPTSTTTSHSYVYAESAHSDELESMRSASRASSSAASRRLTLHEFPQPSHSDPAGGRDGSSVQEHARRSSRRLSVGSTLSSMDGIQKQAPHSPVPALSRQAMSNSDGIQLPFTSAPAPAPRTGSAMGRVQIKKTRATTKPRKSPLDPSTANSSATALVSNVSSSLPVNSLPMPSSSSRSAHQHTAPVPASQNSGSVSVDALTTGIKKITLKVGSREEHERKQKEKEAAERRARALKGAETRRVNAAAKKAAAATEAKKTEISTAITLPVASTSSVIPQPSVPLPPTMPSEPAVQIPPAMHAPGVVGTQYSLLQPAPMRTLDSQQTLSGAAAVPCASIDEHAVPNTPLGNHTASITPTNTLLSSAGSVAPPLAYNNLSQLPGISEPTFRYIPDAQPTCIPSLQAVQQNDMVSEPVTAKKTTSPVPPPPFFPDSATRQLIHENDIANGLPTVVQHAPIYNTSSPTGGPRSPNGRNLPVWNSTGPIPFAPNPMIAPPAATAAENSNGNEPGIPDQGKAGMSRGDLSTQTTVQEQSATPRDGANIWDVPETPPVR